MELAFTVVPSIAANIRPLPRACTDRPKSAAIWCNSVQLAAAFKGSAQFRCAQPIRLSVPAICSMSFARFSPPRWWALWLTRSKP